MDSNIVSKIMNGFKEIEKEKKEDSKHKENISEQQKLVQWTKNLVMVTLALVIVTLIVSLLSIFFSISSPSILDKWIYHPNLEVSPYIFNSSLKISIYNDGLKEGLIESIGYCYYDIYNKTCKEGILKNYFDLPVIKSKESKVLGIDEKIDRSQIMNVMMGERLNEFGIIVCTPVHKCEIYLFSNPPYCSEESIFIKDGNTILLQKYHSRKQISLSNLKNAMVLTSIKCD